MTNTFNRKVLFIREKQLGPYVRLVGLSLIGSVRANGKQLTRFLK